MVEVTVKLRFITPCLGGRRSHDENTPDIMLRDHDGNVIFLATWWKAILTYGAQAFSKHQNEVSKIQWDPVVDGVTTVYKRHYTEFKYKEHEAFREQSIIGVRAMLPDSIPVEDFQRILELAGRYRGISHYGHDKGFGRFEVVEARKT